MADQVMISVGGIDAAVAALARGARLVVDVRMVAAGLNRERLARLGVEVVVAVDAPGCRELATELGITRAAAGILALRDRLDGAVVAVGNAPTALLALLDLCGAGLVSPAGVIGLPVGFVAAAESKAALLASGLPAVTIRGTRGGSPLAAAAINHLLRLAAGPLPDAESGDTPLRVGEGSAPVAEERVAVP